MNSATVSLPLISYNDRRDILSASQQQAVSAVVQSRSRQYYTINVSQSMQQLTNVGICLQLAYAGSKNFACCAKIVGILSSYQTLVKDSHLACQTFVTASLTALKYHVVALRVADRDTARAFGIIAKCADLAKEMEQAAQDLIGDAEELSQKAQDALIDAVREESISETARREIIKAMQALKARETELKQTTQTLETLIREDQRLETRTRQQAAQARNEAGDIASTAGFVLFFTFGLINPFEKVAALSAEAQELQAQANRAERARRKREDLHQATNAELAASIEKLKHNTQNNNDLLAAIDSLQISINALGKIKTVFENTRMFWEGVGKHCRALSNIDVIQTFLEVDMANEAKEEMHSSGLNWLSLGMINEQALQAITHVDRSVDRIMSNLPSKQEAFNLINNTAKSLLEQIEAESNRNQ